MTSPYAQAALYFQAGWHGVLPLPLGEKFPPPNGYTGADGAVPEVNQIVAWSQQGPANLALRLPAGVIGVDVDHYGDKPGMDTLLELMTRLGPLPATWSSTSRGADSPARVWLYRLPQADLRLTGKAGLGIDVLQHHHRYIVAAPSQHPEGGVYAWYRPDFTPADPHELPLVADLPFLPDAWVAELLEQPRERPMPPPVAGEQPADGWAAFMGQKPPHSLRAAHQAVARELAAAAAPASLGSGYRTVLLRAALTLGGYVGAGVLEGSDAAQRLFDSASAAWGGVGDDDDRKWIHQGLTDGQRRPFRVYDDSGSSALFGACCQPCAQGVDPTAGQPPHVRRDAVMDHVRQFGRLPSVFDPSDDNSHHGLAESVLAQLHPNLRFDADTGAWLLRRSDRWHVAKRDASGWAVTEVAPRMPFGVRPTTKDKTEWSAENWQANRRTLFMSSTGSAPVAKRVRDQLAAGQHPSHVRLSELDADPLVLWAGGLPWDLRTGALAAHVDPLTPHAHAARFAPVEGPTPRWDAFTAAVWPDAEIREWALQVLSVALTGHSPRVMPVLHGETGRGKTQVVTLLIHLLGTYGQQVDQRLVGRTEPPGHVVAQLRGLRLAYLDEAAPVDMERVERVKMLTGGGGSMTADQKYLDAFTWDPTHTLVLTQNRAPELTDDALRDRARVIPCDGDPDAVYRTRAALGDVAGETWAGEAPGVLAAMLRRAAAWLADGSVVSHARTPSSVTEAVENMVREQDPVQQWLEERTTPAEPGTLSRLLHADFALWFKGSPLFGRRTVPTAVDFGRRLTRLSVGSSRVPQGMFRHLALNQPGGAWFAGPTPLASLAEPVPAPEYPMLDDAGCVQDAESTSYMEEPQVNTDNDLGVYDMYEDAICPPNKILNGVSKNVQGVSTHPSSCTDDHAPQAVTSANEAVQDPSPDPAPIGTSVPSNDGMFEVSEPPAKPKRTRRKPGELTPAQQRKVEEKAVKQADAAGETVELPAVVKRTAPTPRHVGHVHIGPLLTDAMAKSEGHLTVDCETSGYPIGHPLYALRTVQLGTRVMAVDLDADCAPCCAIATAALKRALVLHAHNAAADIPSLHHADIATHDELWAKMEDTVIPAKLADPSSSGGDPALKAASAAVLGDRATSPAADERRSALFAANGWLKDTDPTTPAEKSGWLQVDKRSAMMISYACSDVLDGALLALELPAPDPAVHAREKHIQRVVAPASTFGFPLDRDRVLQQHDSHDVGEKALREQLRDVLRIDNPGSTAQLGGALLGMGVALPMTDPSSRYPQGQPSTAKDVMNTLAERSGPAQAIARLVLDWRHHDTALKLLLRPWRIAVLQGDGRVRPTVYTLGADTGRMSCVRPNMQQVSKKGGIRECILADDGFMIVSADFEGVELRVAAALSGDLVLRSALEQGLDIHRMIAAQVFGEALADECRTLAKRIVFGYIYGGGFKTLAKQSGVSVEIVAAAVDALQKITPRLAEWSEEIKGMIRAGNRQFRTYAGRVIHLDPRFPHKGPNYLIQGTARELLGDALTAWDATAFGGGILMPVHDETVAMVAADRAQDGLDTLMRVMTRQLGDIAITASAGGPPARSWHSG